MIQRVQTLWMIATTALMCAAIFLPAAYFPFAGGVFKAMPYGIVAAGPAGEMVAAGDAATGNSTVISGLSTCVTVVMAIAALLPLVTIFLYVNRKIQTRMLAAEFFVLACGVVSLGYYIYVTYGEMTAASAGFRFSFFPLLVAAAFVTNGLALHGVRRDEAIVRSVDRIR